MTSYALNTSRDVAVDRVNEWFPMYTCPVGVKVQLLGPGNVATYGTYNGKDRQWQGWFPVPKLPNWIVDKDRKEKEL